MRIYFTLLFLFSLFLMHAQEIMDKDALKKCRKEFNKKTCLSDEDGDGILFYLDQCPKEKGPVENNGCPWPDKDKDGSIDKEDSCPDLSGPVENNGCPWPDTDNDGILDKDDKCPTVEGLPEYGGCPKPFRRDCRAIAKKDSLDMMNLRASYKDVDKIYNQLSKKILEPINKYNLKNIRLYIKLIDWGPSCLTGDGCDQNWKHIQSNYLSTQFWNKTTLERLYNRKDINGIFFSTKFWPEIFPELKEFVDPPLYNYLVKHYKKERTISVLKNDKDQYQLVIISMYFENPHQIRVLMTDSNRFYTDTTYMYNGKTWNTIK
ncbi:hypothetical protein SAMN02787100_1661 [Chryseobacterium sp. OV279]|nr:hypothetical protein SAMN02787100_1661 [Chryseobacterium sp. OV279]